MVHKSGGEENQNGLSLVPTPIDALKNQYILQADSGENFSFCLTGVSQELRWQVRELNRLMILFDTLISRCPCSERLFNLYAALKKRAEKARFELHQQELHKGILYCWGNNKSGKLGIGQVIIRKPTPGRPGEVKPEAAKLPESEKYKENEEENANKRLDDATLAASRLSISAAVAAMVRAGSEGRTFDIAASLATSAVRAVLSGSLGIAGHCATAAACEAVLQSCIGIKEEQDRADRKWTKQGEDTRKTIAEKKAAELITNRLSTPIGQAEMIAKLKERANKRERQMIKLLDSKDELDAENPEIITKQRKESEDNSPAVLVVSKMRCVGLPIADKRSSDPYLQVLVEGMTPNAHPPGEVHRTTKLKKNLNPTWDSNFKIDFDTLLKLRETKLICKVWDWDIGGEENHDLMCTRIVRLDNIEVENDPKEHKYILECVLDDGKQQMGGQLYLEMSIKSEKYRENDAAEKSRETEIALQREKEKNSPAARKAATMAKKMAFVLKRLREVLTDAFHRYDADKSGEIDMDELKEMFDDLGIELSRKEMRVAMRSLDADGSGEADLEEFLDWMLESQMKKVSTDSIEKNIIEDQNDTKSDDSNDEIIDGVNLSQVRIRCFAQIFEKKDKAEVLRQMLGNAMEAARRVAVIEYRKKCPPPPEQLQIEAEIEKRRQEEEAEKNRKEIAREARKARKAEKEEIMKKKIENNQNVSDVATEDSESSEYSDATDSDFDFTDDEGEDVNDWKEKLDIPSGCSYLYNTKTGQIRWKVEYQEILAFPKIMELHSEKYFNNQRVTRISVGDKIVFALCGDNILYTWGQGKYGKLGLGHYNDQYTPELVKLPKKPLLEGARIIEIRAGRFHSGIVFSNGEVYLMGSNSHGQLGLGDFGTDCKKVCKPTRVPIERYRTMHGYKIKSIALGGWHTIFLSEPYTRDIPRTIRRRDFTKVYSCGRGDHGQVGLFPWKLKLYVPTEIPDFEWRHIVQIECGSRHSLALERCGDVYSWGDGNIGATGQGDRNIRLTPCRIEMFDHHKWVSKIGCGPRHCIAACYNEVRALPEKLALQDARNKRQIKRKEEADLRIAKIEEERLSRIEQSRALLAGEITSADIEQEKKILQDKTIQKKEEYQEKHKKPDFSAYNGYEKIKKVKEWKDSQLALKKEKQLKAKVEAEGEMDITYLHCVRSGKSEESVTRLFLVCHDCQIAPICLQCAKQKHRGHCLSYASWHGEQFCAEGLSRNSTQRLFPFEEDYEAEAKAEAETEQQMIEHREIQERRRKAKLARQSAVAEGRGKRVVNTNDKSEPQIKEEEYSFIPVEKVTYKDTFWSRISRKRWWMDYYEEEKRKFQCEPFNVNTKPKTIENQDLHVDLLTSHENKEIKVCKTDDDKQKKLSLFGKAKVKMSKILGGK